MNRRSFLTGLGSIVAAPAIVPFASLMPVRGIIMDVRHRLTAAEVEILTRYRSQMISALASPVPAELAKECERIGCSLIAELDTMIKLRRDRQARPIV